jgi:ribosomal protein L10
MTIIIGGEGPSGVAKTRFKFSKGNKHRMGAKGSALSRHSLAASEIKALSELLSFEVLRAQVLALLSAPGQQLVPVCDALPQGVVNVLQAREREIQCLKKK